MSINSKKKGAKGERELASKLREYGYSCRRRQQYNGLEGEDVVGLDYIHCEVKRVEALNLDGAMEQAKRDSKKIKYQQFSTEKTIKSGKLQWN